MYNNSVKAEVRSGILACSGPTKSQMELLSDLRREYAGCYGDFEKDLEELFRILLSNADSAGYCCADLMRYYATITHAKQLFQAFVVG